MHPSPPSVSRLICLPKLKLSPASTDTPFPQPLAFGIQQCTFWLWFWLFWELHISGIKQYLSAPTWYGNTFLRLIYVLWKVVPFFFPLCYTGGSYVCPSLPLCLPFPSIRMSLLCSFAGRFICTIFICIWFLHFVTFTTIKNNKKRCRVYILEYIHVYSVEYFLLLFSC